MLQGLRVVGVTPAGRRRYIELLVPYLLRSRQVFDEYHLWANTTDREDLAYLDQLSRDFHPFFRVIPAEMPVQGVASIFHFFKHARQPGTMYIRIDDDVCWLAANAVERLADFRQHHRDPFLVYANTVNNVICSHIHQRLGRIPLSAGIATYNPFCSIGWGSGSFAQDVHERFLRAIQDRTTSLYEFDRWVLWEFERVSINMCSWMGEDMIVPEIVDEEHWIAVECPRRLNRPNVICGGALVSHFAYHTQRVHLESTDLLGRYADLVPRSHRS
jgi:hypothetical protein